ncbi:neutral and basic amino acid transport protein rBAT [Trichonephila inaurata madagascariensis]|uniref:alpha-glucosidase n=1 Tax=Trichonephila inaurata madagascariensis TaxID=2747483 RepID=A0A8X7C131_9ARAC|nr:neutral and basic amino acid transport protein rBAT [Trichonephila inaurata madagascariensis]
MDKNLEQAACNGADQHEDAVDNMDEEAAAKEKLTANDPSKVKFTSVNLDGKNGDAKIDIHVAQTTVGMGKEELMKYANEPFWVRLRMFLFILFWVAWLGMLVGAVVIIIQAPRCPPAPTVQWFQKSAMYQIDLDTFQDADGSEVKDLKGLASKIDHLKEQNVDAVMLSAFYKSEKGGILDHKEIEASVGTLADFEELVKQLKEKDIRLVIDFNPNHSSDKHPWFLASLEGQEPYKDFYVWADSPTDDESTPPNNWLNVNGESAWIWKEERQQFYLNTFGAHLPDFNLRNELVKQELRDVVMHWMEKGVDGFKVVAASHLIEDADLRDEPIATVKETNKRKYKDINHIYTIDHPENLGLFAEWRHLISNFSQTLPKILMAEVSGSLNGSMLYYGNETFTLAELPYDTHFTEVNEEVTGIELKHHFDKWVHHVPSYGWPTLLVGSKNVPSLSSRVGEDLVDAIYMLATITKGTPIFYSGDKVGVSNVPSENKVQDKSKQSHSKILSRLLALRGQPALNFGLQAYPIVTNETISLIRVRKGSPGYLVVVNLGKDSVKLDFTGKSGFLPETARVEIRSSNIVDGPLMDGEHPKISLDDVHLGPKQSVVFSFVPIFEG